VLFLIFPLHPTSIALILEPSSLDAKGHFISHHKTQTGHWRTSDDRKVTQVDIAEVLETEGYMLIYHQKKVALADATVTAATLREREKILRLKLDAERTALEDAAATAAAAAAKLEAEMIARKLEAVKKRQEADKIKADKRVAAAALEADMKKLQADTRAANAAVAADAQRKLGKQTAAAAVAAECEATQSEANQSEVTQSGVTQREKSIALTKAADDDVAKITALKRKAGHVASSALQVRSLASSTQFKLQNLSFRVAPHSAKDDLHASQKEQETEVPDRHKHRKVNPMQKPVDCARIPTHNSKSEYQLTALHAGLRDTDGFAKPIDVEIQRDENCWLTVDLHIIYIHLQSADFQMGRTSLAALEEYLGHTSTLATRDFKIKAIGAEKEFYPSEFTCITSRPNMAVYNLEMMAIFGRNWKAALLKLLNPFVAAGKGLCFSHCAIQVPTKALLKILIEYKVSILKLFQAGGNHKFDCSPQGFSNMREGRKNAVYQISDCLNLLTIHRREYQLLSVKIWINDESFKRVLFSSIIPRNSFDLTTQYIVNSKAKPGVVLIPTVQVDLFRLESDDRIGNAVLLNSALKVSKYSLLSNIQNADDPNGVLNHGGATLEVNTKIPLANGADLCIDQLRMYTPGMPNANKLSSASMTLSSAPRTIRQAKKLLKRLGRTVISMHPSSNAVHKLAEELFECIRFELRFSSNSPLLDLAVWGNDYYNESTNFPGHERFLANFSTMRSQVRGKLVVNDFDQVVDRNWSMHQFCRENKVFNLNSSTPLTLPQRRVCGDLLNALGIATKEVRNTIHDKSCWLSNTDQIQVNEEEREESGLPVYVPLFPDNPIDSFLGPVTKPVIEFQHPNCKNAKLVDWLMKHCAEVKKGSSRMPRHGWEKIQIECVKLFPAAGTDLKALKKIHAESTGTPDTAMSTQQSDPPKANSEQFKEPDLISAEIVNQQKEDLFLPRIRKIALPFTALEVENLKEGLIQYGDGKVIKVSLL